MLEDAQSERGSLVVLQTCSPKKTYRQYQSNYNMSRICDEEKRTCNSSAVWHIHAALMSIKVPDTFYAPPFVPITHDAGRSIAAFGQVPVRSMRKESR